MSKPYQPSNGSEGMMFMAEFCDRCKRDRDFQLYLVGKGPMAEGCEISARALIYRVEDPEYPKEWVWDPDVMKREGALVIGGAEGARCTAFEPE